MWSSEKGQVWILLFVAKRFERRLLNIFTITSGLVWLLSRGTHKLQLLRKKFLRENLHLKEITTL